MQEHCSEWCQVVMVYPTIEGVIPYWQINLIPPHSGLYDGFNFGLPIAYKFSTDTEAIEFMKQIDNFMNENHHHEKNLAAEIWSEMSFFEKVKAKWVTVFAIVFAPLEILWLIAVIYNIITKGHI